MSTNTRARGNFRFGVFELSRTSGTLLRKGIPVKLPPQPAQVLLLLVERAGDVVTRDEIQQLIWSDSTVVDFEVGINRCIRRIRSALLDDADAPRYLETIPRIGYRFIAPVEKSEKGLPPSPTPETPVLESVATEVGPARASELIKSPRRWKQIAIAIGIICVAALAASVFRMRSGEEHPKDLHTTPLAVSLGDHYAPSFSPDGRQVAFSWNGDVQDNFDIYVKLVNLASQPLRLTSSKDVDYSPAWSPDGQWIAFCRGTDSGEGAIWIIPALGGAERKIADLHVPGSPWTRLLSWTPNSKRLIVAAPLAPGGPLSLQSVDVSTGSKNVLTRPSAPDEDLHPAVSPNGQFVAFTRDVGRGISRILVVPIDGGTPEPVRIPAPNVYNARAAWTPDSRNIIFVSNTGGELHVWLSRFRSHQPAKELAALGGGIQDVNVSQTGQLGIVRQSANSNVYVFDVDAAVQHAGALPRRVLATTRIEESPSIRPDGKQIAFASNRSGYKEIWTARIDGSDPTQITYLQNPATGSPDWSPDGGRLIFDSRTGERPQLYITSADGGKAQPVCCSTSLSIVPRWSHRDGKIYFSSDRTGRMEIWRVAPEGGDPVQVTKFGGFGPISSPDGKWLYYAADNAPITSLWKQDLLSGERRQLIASVLRRSFAPASNGVYFFSGSTSSQQSRLYWLDEQSNRSTLLFTGDRRIGDGAALAPDERSLYFTQFDVSGCELLLVQNFWR